MSEAKSPPSRPLQGKPSPFGSAGAHGIVLALCPHANDACLIRVKDHTPVDSLIFGDNEPLLELVECVLKADDCKEILRCAGFTDESSDPESDHVDYCVDEHTVARCITYTNADWPGYWQHIECNGENDLCLLDESGVFQDDPLRGTAGRER